MVGQVNWVRRSRSRKRVSAERRAWRGAEKKRGGAIALSTGLTFPGQGKIIVDSSIPFSKRYIKYLTKKFLKKSALRDWLRVVSTGKNTYTLKFFNLAYDQDANEDDE